MPETGNILIDYGGMSWDQERNTAYGINNHHWFRIAEVTRTSPAETVFELIVEDESPRGWLAFQTERLPSLYP